MNTSDAETPGPDTGADIPTEAKPRRRRAPRAADEVVGHTRGCAGRISGLPAGGLCHAARRQRDEQRQRDDRCGPHRWCRARSAALQRENGRCASSALV